MPVVTPSFHESLETGRLPVGPVKGEETPLLARIVAVADSIDAICRGFGRTGRVIPDQKLDAFFGRGGGG